MAQNREWVWGSDPLRTAEEAAGMIRRAADPVKIIVFGSVARGDWKPDSDVDLMVVLPIVSSRYEAMVAFNDLLRPLRVPIDVLVYSSQDIAEWGRLPGTTMHQALTEGRVLYEAA